MKASGVSVAGVLCSSHKILDHGSESCRAACLDGPGGSLGKTVGSNPLWIFLDAAV